jgi:plasmid stability protein
MRRTLIQLDDTTYSRLRQQAFRQARSMSSLVREIVARGLEADTGRKRRTRVSQFSSVGAGRSKPGRSSPVSEKHDEALSAAYDR